jgi:hypothetical protein
VLHAYASDLEGRNRHEDAALAHLVAGDMQRAQQAYRAAGEWRMALALAGESGAG